MIIQKFSILYRKNIRRNEMENKENLNPKTTKKQTDSSEFKTVKAGTSTNYTFSEEAPKKKKSSSTHFGTQVVLPFFSGLLGTVVVLGSCLYVPSVRSRLVEILGANTQSQTTTSVSNPINNILSENKSLVSLSNLSETGIGVASKVQPSIVGITVEYSINSPFSNSTSTAKAEGSGIIIREDGYILTNNHVVNSTSTSSFYEVGKANKVTVYLHNEEVPFEGKIIGTDEQTDLAVIKIEKTGLPAAELGNSSTVQVGEFAMAVGNPLGMESSVTSGIVSAVNREITDSDGITYSLIQTDAAINSGNSGGALVNAKGQVIGVNFLKVSGTGVEGLGFAIPVNDAKEIAEQLIQYNKVKRPYMGISGLDLSKQEAQRYRLVEGIYIRSVEDFSAAQKADLRIGDVIIKFDGKDVKTMNELNAIKNTHKIGDEITLVVNRSGEEKEIKITLSEQP